MEDTGVVQLSFSRLRRCHLYIFLFAWSYVSQELCTVSSYCNQNLITVFSQNEKKKDLASTVAFAQRKLDTSGEY